VRLLCAFIGFQGGNLLTMALFMPQIKKHAEARKDALYSVIVKPKILALLQQQQ
jgi:hypothetical protein